MTPTMAMVTIAGPTYSSALVTMAGTLRLFELN
jgi:hypothetical protein